MWTGQFHWYLNVWCEFEKDKCLNRYSLTNRTFAQNWEIACSMKKCVGTWGVSRHPIAPMESYPIESNLIGFSSPHLGDYLQGNQLIDLYWPYLARCPESVSYLTNFEYLLDPFQIESFMSHLIDLVHLWLLPDCVHLHPLAVFPKFILHLLRFEFDQNRCYFLGGALYLAPICQIADLGSTKLEQFLCSSTWYRKSSLNK